jgi:hypothetical protein
MSRLVLREQVASARAGGEINDYVSAKTLSKREEEQLVACFRNIQALRAGLRVQLTEGGV